jgi:hypothetical protein
MTPRVLDFPTVCDELAQPMAAGRLPRAPRTPEDTGLPPTALAELALKVMLQHGLAHLAELSQHLRLAPSVLEAVFPFLRKETLVEVQRRGATDGDVRYALTQAGRARAHEALERNLYTGPAPVTLEDYVAQVQAQSVFDMGITEARLARGLQGVVLGQGIRDQLGAAMNSRRAIMLYGPAGSGKTFIAEQMGRLLHGQVAIPHAIWVDGEIVRVFDPLVHHPAAEAVSAPRSLDSRGRSDARWVLCQRPVVTSGGELTLEMLDLVFDPRAGYYQAPPHVKANNGLFLVDDLGRQIVTPRQLMNRWIVPMERRHDYLMLRNGGKFCIPFDVMLVFSTNLAPSDVADEAFLRRIGYKIFVGAVGRDDYRQILLDVCASQGVAFDEPTFERLLADYHVPHQRPLLACYPRDLINQVADFAAYHGRRPEFTPELLHWAWHNYFATHSLHTAAPRD